MLLISVPLGLVDTEAGADSDNLEAMGDGVLYGLGTQLLGGQLVGIVLQGNPSLLLRTRLADGVLVLLQALGHVCGVVPVHGVNVPVDDGVACAAQVVEYVVVHGAVGRAHKCGPLADDLFDGGVDYGEGM